MTHAERIHAAQQYVLATTALRDTISTEIDAALPAPDPGDDDGFNIWNDRLEDEMESSGYNAAYRVVRVAEDELCAAGAAWVRDVRPESVTLDLLAMVERGDPRARNQFVYLLMRLDTSTVKA